MPKDGVVGIGLRFEYKEALDKMVSDLGSHITKISNEFKKVQFAKDMGGQIHEISSVLTDFVNNTNKKFEEINEQKIDASAFEAFRSEANKQINDVIQSVTSLKKEVGNLGQIDITSNVKQQLEDFKIYLSNLIPSLGEIFERIESQTNITGKIDISSLEAYKKIIAEINLARKELFNLDFSKNTDDELFERLTQQEELLKNQVETYETLKAKMMETPKKDPGFAQTEIDLARQQMAVQKTIETIEGLDLEIATRDLGAGMEDSTRTLISALQSVDIEIDKFVSRTQKMIQAREQAQTSFNTFKVKDGAIHVPVDVIKSEQAAERLNEVIASLQKLAKNHPIYAEVQLVAGTKKSGYQKNKDIAKELDTDKNPIDLGGSIRKAYKDALREVKEEAQGLINEVMSNFEKRKFPIHPDSEAFTKELQEMVNTSMGEVAGNETGLNINKDLEGLVKNLQAVAGILSGSKNFTFGLDEASIERITASINSMANMIQRAFGVASDTDIANQWSAIENRFKAVAGEEGKLLKSNKEHKAAIQEIVVEYQKYLDMGGRNDFSALTKHARTVTNLTEAYEELIKAEEEARKQQEQQATQKEEPVTSKRSKGKGAIEKTTEANQKLETQAGRTSAAIKLEAGAAQSASEKFRKLAKEKGNAAYANRQLAEAAIATAEALEREARARKEGAGKTPKPPANAIDKDAYLLNSQKWQEDITSLLSGEYAEVYEPKISQGTNGVAKFRAYVTKSGDDVSNLDKKWKLFTATVDQYGNIVSPTIVDATEKQVIAIGKQKIAMERYLELLERVRAQEELQPLERKDMEAHIQSLIAEDKNLDRFRIKDIQLGDRGGLSIITELKEAGGVVKTFKADFDSVNMVIDESGKLVGDLDQKLESGFSSGKFTAKIKDTTGEIDTLQSKASKALDSFEKKFKDSSNFSKIKRQVDSLRGSIDKIGDQSGLDKWLGRLNKAEDKIKNLDIVSSLRAKAKQSISKLESELKSSSNYSQISAPLKELKKEIKNINSQGDLDALISKLSALKTTVKDSDSFQSKASKALSTFMLNNKDSGGFSQVEGQLEALKGTITSINSQADLDRFNEQLKEIEHNLRRINAVSRFHVNDIEVISRYEELYNTLKKIGSLKIKLAGLSQGTEQYKLLKTEIDALEVAYDKLLAKFREHPDYGSFVADVEQELANVRKETDARTKEIEEKRINRNKTYQQSAQDAMNRFTSENQKDPFFSQIRKGVDALRDSISQIDSGEKLKKFNNDLSAIKSNFRTIKADNKLGEILSDGRTFKNISEVRANIDSLFASVGKVNEKSIRINGANKLTAEVKMANGEIHKMNVSLDSNNFARYVDAGIVQFGRLRGAAEKAFKGIWQMMRIYISPYRFVQLIRQGVNQIKEMDTAITELRKVSDAPMADISAYFDDAVASSKELGSSVKDMIGATADWARMGYNLPDSRELGEIAVLYKNVGDGISIEEANSSLVSTLQGFQLETKDAIEIVDKFNEVAR